MDRKDGAHHYQNSDLLQNSYSEYVFNRLNGKVRKVITLRNVTEATMTVAPHGDWVTHIIRC